MRVHSQLQLTHDHGKPHPAFDCSLLRSPIKMMQAALAWYLTLVTTGVRSAAGFADSSSRSLQDMNMTQSGMNFSGPCPTICANGTAMSGVHNLLPGFYGGYVSCRTISFLQSQNGTVCAAVASYSRYLDFAAMCQCDGVRPPALCNTCSGGGSVTQPYRVFSVPFLDGFDLSCQEGQGLANYLGNEVACNGFTGTYYVVSMSDC
jgi:hypothetical protein